MLLDVVIISSGLCDVYHGCSFTYLKKYLKDYPYLDKTVFIKPISKRANFNFSWRILPNRSTEFYRCPRVDIIDQPFLNELNNGV